MLLRIGSTNEQAKRELRSEQGSGPEQSQWEVADETARRPFRLAAILNVSDFLICFFDIPESESQSESRRVRKRTMIDEG